MKVLNDTFLTYGPLLWLRGPSQYMLTVVVKGTFKLRHDGNATPLVEQPYPTGDELYANDSDGSGEVRYESDFAFFKPNADFLLIGKCHLPKGVPGPGCIAGVRAGPLEKNLSVMGDRYWGKREGIMSPSPPKYFTEMELSYRNSFGGKGFIPNPVGKGAAAKVLPDGGKLLPLPNIELPRNRVVSPDDRPEPAGFGPLLRTWPQRNSKLGTYNDEWLAKHWPGFPQDFDWKYFNAAPEDQQLSGYFKGNEELFFQNLHPQYPGYSSRLPGLRVRCFTDSLIDSNQTHFHEVEMNLDTVWVDMEAETMSLVWRGTLPVQSDDYEEIKTLYLVSEGVKDKRKPVEYYREQLAQRILTADTELDIISGELGAKVAADTSISAEIAKVVGEIKADLHAAGIDSEKKIPSPSPEALEQEAILLKKLGIELEEKPALTREAVIKRVASGRGFNREDLRGLDLSGLQLGGVDLYQCILSRANLNGVDLTAANLTGANLNNADLSGAALCRANLCQADLTNACLEQADLTSATLDEALFNKARMEKAVLDQTHACYTDFTDANLNAASFRQAKLTGADFARSELKQAVFFQADLTDASIEGVMGIGLNMFQATLTCLRASEGADLRQAHFNEAKGEDSIWTDANLEQADFSFSQLPGADFTAANLQGTYLHAAEMSGAKLVKANLQNALLTSMKLFQGSLEQADLTDADLSGSNLYGVEFLNTVLVRTKFNAANLKMTKLDREHP